MGYDSRWVEQNYPKDGCCKYKYDRFNNLGKKREEITGLDISCGYGNIANKIKGEIDLRDFTNLEELACTNNKLTNLKLDGLNKLEKVDCSDNDFNHLVIEDLPNLNEINCTKNKGLTNLKLKNCPNLRDVKCPIYATLDIDNCPRLTVTYHFGSKEISKLYLSKKINNEHKRLQEENDQLKQVITELEESPVINKKNILVIGRTGSGKSTLANVLVNENEEFVEIFKEDNISGSVTTQLQVEETEIDGVEYRIIDTVGFGDTGTVTGNNAVLEAVKATYAVKEGISQILFVVRGRSDIDEKEMKFYNSLKEEIFGEKILEYTTIVRTNFSSFNNNKKCNEDIEVLKKNVLISQLASSCNKIIHVDNPSLSIQSEDLYLHHRKSRGISRQKLTSHLSTCKNIYRPRKLKEVISQFDRELSNRGIIIDRQLIKSNNPMAFEKIKGIVEIAQQYMPIVVSLVEAGKFVALHSAACQIS